MSKSKLCICSEFPPPYGGIGLQAIILATALEQDNGFEVHRVSTTLPDCRLGVQLNKIRWLRTIARALLFFSRCIQRFSKVTVVHILTGSYLNFFIFTTPAVVLSKIYNKPVIIHYHGGAAGEFLHRWGLFVRPILRMANAIVTPSGFLKSIFAKHRLHSIIIPNIINLDSFNFEERNTFKPKILVTRHLEPLYNISCAIRGFTLLLKSFPEATLTVAGSGSEKTLLERLASDLGCIDRISFLGAVNSQRIHELYSANDILLNTSYVDNLPLSILEGFACGLLVVSTNAGGIPYIIDHKKNGLIVNLNDHIGVAETISWALANQKESRQIVKNAQESIECFTWAKIKPLLTDLYEQVA